MPRRTRRRFDATHAAKERLQVTELCEKSLMISPWGPSAQQETNGLFRRSGVPPLCMKAYGQLQEVSV
jgi:hypothetical protein